MAEPAPVALRQQDAKLVFLAVAYHLGRPGSELDPTSKQPVEHGLAETARELQPQMRQAVATINLNADQVTRLLSAMAGSMTELKAYPMLEPRPGGIRKSTVPGFDGTLRHLFPEVEEDVENAIDLAERMLVLRRRLAAEFGATRRPADSAIEPVKPARKRGFWPFSR
jgi:hypothetical protein